MTRGGNAEFRIENAECRASTPQGKEGTRITWMRRIITNCRSAPPQNTDRNVCAMA